MRNEPYNIEGSIEKCLEKHPGASAKKIFRFCKNTVEKNSTDEAAVYSKLRKMKKKRKVINKADCWFLLMKKKDN